MSLAEHDWISCASEREAAHNVGPGLEPGVEGQLCILLQTAARLSQQPLNRSHMDVKNLRCVEQNPLDFACFFVPFQSYERNSYHSVFFLILNSDLSKRIDYFSITGALTCVLLNVLIQISYCF